MTISKLTPDYVFLQASEELEDRESLAVLAASGMEVDKNKNNSKDISSSFMEQYTKGKKFSIYCIDLVVYCVKL